MTIFLNQQKKYNDAPVAYDPLAKTWMFSLIDPWPSNKANADPQWLRIAIFVAILFIPLPLCCFTGSPTFGGSFIGKGSFTADIGIFAILLFLIISASLLPVARRVLGDLPNELLRHGVVNEEILDFDPRTMKLRPILRILEWLSRVDGYRGFIWFILLLIEQLAVYRFAFLNDALQRWITSDLSPGTAMYFLAGNLKQPTVAGFWAFIVWGPTILYLMIIIARLLVVFACFCIKVSKNRGLNIMPSHPDGTGGLSAIGQTALLLSLFTFALGIDLAGITFNELVTNKVFSLPDDPISSNMKIVIILWLLYLGIGTILFILPLVPLRKKMSEAKRNYLLNIIQLRVAAEDAMQKDISVGEFPSDALKELGTLNSLYTTTNAMAVWPFDTKTAIRYGGLLISPLSPIVASQISNITKWIKSYLGM